MQPETKDPITLADKRTATLPKLRPLPNSETKEERDAQLLILLGEVIRLSQAWVRALEDGDPFTAEKWEAECIRAMDRFEANRKKIRLQRPPFEQTL
jgi:hypothetical protein